MSLVLNVSQATVGFSVLRIYCNHLLEVSPLFVKELVLTTPIRQEELIVDGVLLLGPFIPIVVHLLPAIPVIRHLLIREPFLADTDLTGMPMSRGVAGLSRPLRREHRF